jgi:DNA-binding NtrC family response regulator
MTPIEQGTDLKALVTAYERRLILDALEASGGHQRRTARRLGLLPTTLHEKMKRLGLISHTRSEQVLSLDRASLPSPATHQVGGLTLAPY